MCVMAVSVTNCAQMVTPKLWVITMSSGMLGILCRGGGSVIVRRVGLLATSLRLVVTPIPTFLIPSLPLLVI